MKLSLLFVDVVYVAELIRITAIGNLAPRIGRYKLHEQNLSVPLVRLDHDQPVNRNSIQIVLENRFALLVPQASIPASLRAPFSAAGDKFAADFNRYCPMLVFLPELMKEDQHRETMAAGFALSMVKDVSDEIRRNFLANLTVELPIDLQSVMFLHLLDENGRLLDEQLIHWSLSALIGQAKAAELVISKGFSLSNAGLDTFSLLYQKEMLGELIARGFGNQAYRGACSWLVRGLNAFIAKTFERLDQQEAGLVKN